MIDISDFEIDNFARFRYVKVDKKRDTDEIKVSEYEPCVDYDDEKHNESINSIELSAMPLV